MKTIIFITLILFCVCDNHKQSDVNYIEIRKADFSILTFTSISCDDFEKYFTTDKEIIIINDVTTIKKILDFVCKLKEDTDNYIPDVRAKLLIHYKNNKVDTLCMSQIGLTMYNKSYIVTKEFVDFIDKICYNEK
jgi:hypothetical protein